MLRQAGYLLIKPSALPWHSINIWRRMRGNFEIRPRLPEKGEPGVNTAAERSEAKNPKTGITHAEMKEFIRNHFEEFVNRKNLRIGEVNLAPDFVDHGADVPPGLPPGPARAIQYVGAALKKFPDLSVSIEDLIAAPTGARSVLLLRRE